MIAQEKFIETFRRQASSNSTRKAFDLALTKGILAHFNETFSEFVEVFARPEFDKYITLDDRLKVINLLELRSHLVQVNDAVVACRDPKGDKFLSLAVAVNADFIVTGDLDLIVLHPFKDIVILTPGDFLRHFNEY